MGSQQLTEEVRKMSDEIIMLLANLKDWKENKNNQ
jgi:hypothetical protein